MNMINYILFICFLEAFHCYGTVNVALNKPAYQPDPFYPDDNIGDASNAVDGHKSDLSRNGGQCVVSGGGVTATWWVNLTSIHSIHNITIYYMTDNKPWGASNVYAKSSLGFSVYVSNTTDKETGSLCFKDDNFTLETIPAVFRTTCSVHGQYVIYYNERLRSATYPDSYHYFVENNICEVEVYGCPATGCYGSNNSLPCPDVNCQYCHKETGTCQMCKPGYKGQQCELECETGKYGVNCSKSCGNCLNQSQCHNVDGFCSVGCSAGYSGSLCTEQCDIGKYGITCSETCGNCRNQTHCQNVDGLCSEGCSAGYKGSLCTERKYCIKPGESQESQASEASVSGVDRLSEFLSICNASPVKKIREPFETSSERTKRKYAAKANECLTLVLETICPGESDDLKDAMFLKCESSYTDYDSPECIKALIDSYLKAETPTVRLQILSILANHYSFKDINV